MFTDTTDQSRPIITPGQRIKTLIVRIAEEHGATYEQVLGRSRLHAVARHAVWYALWKGESWSLSRVAARFDRDRTTIYYGIGSHILASGLPTNWMSLRALRMRRNAEAWNAKQKGATA